MTRPTSAASRATSARASSGVAPTSKLWSPWLSVAGAFVHAQSPTSPASAIRETVYADARIITDENPSYNGIGSEFGGHETVCHSAKEYVRGDVHSNTVEGFFASVKRGLNDIYHSVRRSICTATWQRLEFRYNHRNAQDGHAQALSSAPQRQAPTL